MEAASADGGVMGAIARRHCRTPPDHRPPSSGHRHGMHRGWWLGRGKPGRSSRSGEMPASCLPGHGPPCHRDARRGGRAARAASTHINKRIQTCSSASCAGASALAAPTLKSFPVLQGDQESALIKAIAGSSCVAMGLGIVKFLRSGAHRPLAVNGTFTLRRGERGRV